MFIILFFAIALVAWSLHLMQEAVYYREFSLGLAGTLVATAAAATIGVYFLMNNCVGHLTQMSAYPTASDTASRDRYSSVILDTDRSAETFWNGSDW